jgi:hypothetical protein
MNSTGSKSSHILDNIGQKNRGAAYRESPVQGGMKIMNPFMKPAMLAMVLIGLMLSFNVVLAAGPAEKKGWGIDDPYNKLYNPKEFEKIKAKVVRVMEVVPMAGMSPATAMEVREGGKNIMVHLCPTWFAKPSDTGIKPGDQVTLKGSWADINGKDVFLASKVKKGDFQEFKCRLTKDGTPFWTMTPEQLARELAEKDD